MTATDIYTLSLHDALPIYEVPDAGLPRDRRRTVHPTCRPRAHDGDRLHGLGAGRWGERCEDRKSTRLNSSHTVIPYAVFCLKKKNSGGLQLSLAKPLIRGH